MQKRMQVAGVVAGAATVLLTVLRLCFPPQGTGLRGGYLVTVCVGAAVLFALFLLCGMRRLATKSIASVPAKFLAGATLFVGASLVINAVNDLVDLLHGTYPYPQPITVTAASTLLVWVEILAALIGGLFYATVAVRWYLQGHTDRTSSGLLALLPVVWTWARILWYMTSFASAVNRFRSLFEIAMLLFEMLFLFAFARHIAGMEEVAPRFVLPTALGTALLGFVVCLTRFGALVVQDVDLFDSTALVTAPDPGIALLAALFAIGQLMPRAHRVEEATEEGTEQPEPPVAEDEEDTPEPFLLMETEPEQEKTEDEDEDVIPETERKPLELEDIINEIINGNR